MKKFIAINFWKKVILTSFLELGQKNFRLLLDNFGKKFKISFYVSRRTHTEHRFWKKKLKLSFFRIFGEIFGTMAKKILQVYQNCRNCPEEQIEEKFFRIEKNATSFKILNELSMSFFLA